MSDSSMQGDIGRTGWPKRRRCPSHSASASSPTGRIAWLFIGPTILLLLAINIFPLIWTIYLSFTDYRSNRPNAEIKVVGLRHYERILTDTDIWHACR